MNKLFLILLFSFLILPSYAQIITTVAGNGSSGLTGDGGPATNAEFSELRGVAADKWGNIYVADIIGNVIHKIDNTGIMTRFAGTGFRGLSGDGGPATAAQLYLNLGSVGIAIDSAGNVYFSDGTRIRTVNTFGIITTVVGGTSFGNSGDGGPATIAELYAPTGICFDKSGNLYIADNENNNIRFVTPAGIISTIAGTTIGFSGDNGPATIAQFNSPEGIAVDDSGNVYVCDAGNYRVRKIDALGTVTTFAGCGPLTTGPYLCYGCPATNLSLISPIGVAIDRLGNVYISAILNECIHKITKAGIAYDVVGNGTQGYSGDGGLATAAELHSPDLIYFDNSGDLLITDRGNHVFRKVNFGTENTTLIHPAAVAQFSIYPNPVTNKEFTCNITTTDNEEAKIEVSNLLGQGVYKTTINTNKPTNISVNIPPGLYLITAYTKENKMQSKIVVE